MHAEYTDRFINAKKKNVLLLLQGLRVFFFLNYNNARHHATSATGSIFVENFIKTQTFYNGKRLAVKLHIPLTSPH